MTIRVLCLATILLLCPAGALWADPAPGEVVSEVIKALDLQTRLPGEIEAAEPAVPSDVDRSIVEPVDSSWRFSIPRQWLQIVLAAIVLGGLIVAFLALRNNLPPVSRAKSLSADDAGPAAESDGKMEKAQYEADDYARSGRFVEAMHVLLLQSLSEMRKRLDLNFADSLTSREILRLSSLTDSGRTALGEIIAKVETTYFGERPADAEDYVVCRQHYDQLSRALESRVSA